MLVKDKYVMRGWCAALIFGGFLGYFIGLGVGWLVYTK